MGHILIEGGSWYGRRRSRMAQPAERDPGARGKPAEVFGDELCSFRQREGQLMGRRSWARTDAAAPGPWPGAPPWPARTPLAPAPPFPMCKAPQQHPLEVLRTHKRSRGMEKLPGSARGSERGAIVPWFRPSAFRSSLFTISLDKDTSQYHHVQKQKRPHIYKLVPWSSEHAEMM